MNTASLFTICIRVVVFAADGDLAAESIGGSEIIITIPSVIGIAGLIGEKLDLTPNNPSGTITGICISINTDGTGYSVKAKDNNSENSFNLKQTGVISELAYTVQWKDIELANTAKESNFTGKLNCGAQDSNATLKITIIDTAVTSGTYLAC